jgi:TolB protein
MWLTKHTRSLSIALALSLLCVGGSIVYDWLAPRFRPLVSTNGQIAFTSDQDGNREIYVINIDGSNDQDLTNNPADDEMPRWSSDGERIAFVSDRDGNSEIYTMRANGSEQTNLTDTAAFDTNPIWSADGNQIAFISDRDGEWAIYTMYADGARPTRLNVDYMPFWIPTCSTSPRDFGWLSPDGKQVTFVRDRDIYLADIEETHQIQLTQNASSNWCPVWSPNGARIAFLSTRDTNMKLYIMNADGTQQTRMTHDTSKSERSFTWSLDGTRIAFVAYHGYLNTDIYVMNADGSGLTSLIETPATSEDEISWRPGN